MKRQASPGVERDFPAPSSRGLPFRGHLCASVTLGVPIVATQLTTMLIHTVDTLMLGWLGVAELAAGTLAFQAVFLTYILGLGFSAAMMPLIASARGRSDETEVRRATRMGLWVLTIVVVLFMVPLLYIKPILIALGQETELAELARRYMVIAQWSMIPAFLLAGFRGFLTSLEKIKAIFLVSLGMAILNGFLNYTLIFGNFGAPRLGIEGAAWATVIANIAALGAIALYIIFNRETARYSLFQRVWRPEWAAFRRIWALGVPISLTILAEAGLFAATSIMIGWLGTVPLAAHGIALQVASLAFMVPMGLGQVATVRVGHASGRNDAAAVRRAGHAAILLALGFACVSALIFIAIPQWLVYPFLDDGDAKAPAVLAAAVPLLFVAAAFQIVDGLQVVAAGALRGLQDTLVPLIIAVTSYWPIGLGTAWLIGIHFHYGAVGIWAGLAAGLSLAALLLLARFTAKTKASGLINE